MKQSFLIKNVFNKTSISQREATWYVIEQWNIRSLCLIIQWYFTQVIFFFVLEISLAFFVAVVSW